MTAILHHDEASPATASEDGAALRAAAGGLEALAESIEQAQREQAWRLAGVAHDLRLPLTRLRLQAQMSVSDPEALALMEEDIAEIDALAGELVRVAAPVHARPSRLALQVAVHEAAAPFVKRGWLRLEDRLDPRLWVQAEAGALRRMLRNLLDNACRHAAPSSTGPSQVHVVARALRTGSWVDLGLRDHGPGLPGSLGHAPASGLALTALLAQGMGASLRVRNAAGGGVLAHLRLRAWAGPSSPKAERRATRRHAA